jgi:polyisoprenoid-binding protein YceI
MTSNAIRNFVAALMLGAAAAAGAADKAPAAPVPASATAPTTASGLWAADPAKSTLGFEFVQAGAKTTGRFAKFTANVDFTPADLAKGRIDVSIDMASAETRDKERDDTLRTADLFDTTKFLRSTYQATQFVPKGSGFEGRGKLTLRGVSRDVPITFTFVPGVEAGKPIATLKGTATVKRLLFGVGQGEWKSTEWISDDVAVNFTLLLRPRATKPAIPAQPAPATRK